jgi:hypothetical protein
MATSRLLFSLMTMRSKLNVRKTNLGFKQQPWLFTSKLNQIILNVGVKAALSPRDVKIGKSWGGFNLTTSITNATPCMLYELVMDMSDVDDQALLYESKDFVKDTLRDYKSLFSNHYLWTNQVDVMLPYIKVNNHQTSSRLLIHEHQCYDDIEQAIREFIHRPYLGDPQITGIDIYSVNNAIYHVDIDVTDKELKRMFEPKLSG